MMRGGEAQHRVMRQNNRARCPGRTLNRPKGFLLNLHAHPIRAVFITELRQPAQHLGGFFVLPMRHQRHDKLRRFGHGHPWFIDHTATAKTVNHEIIPTRSQPRLGLLMR